MTGPDRPSVGIVGGGLAGLAAAAALAPYCRVELFEARRNVGGRAASFRDPDSGQLVDHCQHVSMGCCTNLTDFCRRTGIEDLFSHEDVLHFIGPDGRQYDLAATRWLPPPLHLTPALRKLGYLSRSERRGIARAMWSLLRWRATAGASEPAIGQWLSDARQSPRAVEWFWNVILVSALSEKLDRIGVSAARKVFVDGFAASAGAYQLQVPRVPLGELYGRRLTGWLEQRGVQLHLGAIVKQISQSPGSNTRFEVATASGDSRSFDFVVAALTWRQTSALFAEPLNSQIPCLEKLSQIEAAPITGVHLWFDRPITELAHAVLIGRLSQWVFNRGPQTGSADPTEHGHYYQIVISASHELAGQDKQQLVQQVHEELRAIWPAARDAKLLRGKVVTEPNAVFSMTPGVDRLRPAQRTALAGLMLAGDWTATGWPATMEGAVRSGYLAAEAVLDEMGHPAKLLVPDLPRSWLARLLIR